MKPRTSLASPSRVALPRWNGPTMTAIQVPGLLTLTIAIVVFFAGAGLNRLIPPLHRWNIVQANELYIFTHPDMRPPLEMRVDRFLAAYRKLGAGPQEIKR